MSTVENAKTGFVPAWNTSRHEARLWTKLNDDVVQCHLSPRECKMRPGQYGFCGVRKNVNGVLETLNYGRATHVTQETVETEAIFHYAPGAPILSLGNVGCMMNCDYCHNWKTSQARLIAGKDVYEYTPERIVEICLERQIPIISWTYNDPVVWQEFVLDTSRLAKKHGIITLYKSAFFITEKAVDELLEVIDIFSVSIKSMDPVYYRKLTKGWLEPVLEATKQVYRAGKHLEVSNLMVTEANDNIADARRIGNWVLENLSDRVPLHFVRFHPDYKYTHVGRTPIKHLEDARAECMRMGLKYVYLGNVYDLDAVNTYCVDCGALLIQRYGLNATPVGLTDNGDCMSCKRALEYVRLQSSPGAASSRGNGRRTAGLIGSDSVRKEFLWEGDVKSAHIELKNNSDAPGAALIRPLLAEGRKGEDKELILAAHETFRIAASKSSVDDRGVEVLVSNSVDAKLYAVFDRAHFPTVEAEGALGQDLVPLPRFERKGAATTASKQQP